LLSAGMLNTKSKIVVGLTSSSLLLKKKHSYFLEDIEIRKERVLRFLNKFNPEVEVHLFILTDPVGEAGTEEDMTGVILTREVAAGGEMINKERIKNGLKPVEKVFVDMILAADDTGDSSNFSNKTSSTFIREYLQNKFCEDPEFLFKEWCALCVELKVNSGKKAYEWWSKIRDAHC